MTDRKLTDDVIKALECCKGEDIPCKSCPYFDLGSCESAMAEDALALINRQKAQIESLNAVHADAIESLRLAAEANKDMSVELDAMRGAANSYKMHYEEAQAELADLREIVFMDRSEAIKNLKAEAIKEFAEAVKMEFYREFDKVIPSVMADKIDTIVKEMTEEIK